MATGSWLLMLMAMMSMMILVDAAASK